MREEIKKFIRVDHAGEYGAVRIYSGQMAVLGRGRHAPTLSHMLAQEEHHLEVFSGLIAARRVRPTALLPLWHVAGFVLGAATAAMGARAAMACTVAVEETIDAHYAAQEAVLDESEAPLSATIAQFRAEELEHRDIGLANGAEQAPAYRLLTAIIKTGCVLAIKMSERI
jgi:3-demethoxyubiquinol 3-hydroxylase